MVLFSICRFKVLRSKSVISLKIHVSEGIFKGPVSERLRALCLCFCFCKLEMIQQTISAFLLTELKIELVLFTKTKVVENFM